MQWKKRLLPHLRIEESISLLGEVLLFSTLDANHSYGQVEIKYAYCSKAAFTYITDYIDSFASHSDFAMFPGPSNWPWTLFYHNWQFASVYWDKIIIIFRTAGEHIEHVRTVLLLPHRAVVTLSLRWQALYRRDRIFGTCGTPRSIELASHTTDATLDLNYV